MPHGFDIQEMAYDIEYRTRSPHIDQTVELRRRPYILVEPHTTEDDVRNAFRILAAALPRRPRPVKPPRDPLVSVQCAVWYDRYGWSQERIAEHFD
jgi:hypothetical protein